MNNSLPYDRYVMGQIASVAEMGEIMFQKDKEIISKLIDGSSIDFYLEDDMFEIEGAVQIKDGSIIVDVKNAVRHILTLSGEKLEIFMSDRCLCARRIDTDKVFQMEINRIYKRLSEPDLEDFICLKAGHDIDYFFQKQTDTLIWYEPTERRWYMELNRINMFYSGDRRSYPTLEQLFKLNRDRLSGIWQAVTYTSEVDYEEKKYDEYCI